MEEKKKNSNNKMWLFAIVLLGFLVILFGATFAYFSASINKVNETKTKIETNTLGLIYTGEKEINYQSAIPGDSFEKTFTVENTSNVGVTYNIYMEGITNQYNEDLVYTLYETDSTFTTNSATVVSETALPVTNANKDYLKTDINIGAAPAKKYYKLVIEFKYSANNSQNDYQGKVFEATLGVDTERVQANNNAQAPTQWQPTYFAYGTPTTADTTVPMSGDQNPYLPGGKTVFAAMDADGNKGLCFILEGEYYCFKENDAANQQQLLQQLFSATPTVCQRYENDGIREPGLECDPSGIGGTMYYITDSGTITFADNNNSAECSINNGVINCQ